MCKMVAELTVPYKSSDGRDWKIQLVNFKVKGAAINAKLMRVFDMENNLVNLVYAPGDSFVSPLINPELVRTVKEKLNVKS